MKNLSITHPEAYQGQHYPKKHYFEGWYLKHVTLDGAITISIIPGVSYTEHDQHAFIQVLMSNSPTAYYIRYSIDQFSYQGDQFDIRIADNHFSKSGIHLSIDQNGLQLRGRLNYGDFAALHRHFGSPTIMGPLAYLPRMECIHGIVSMSHVLTGVLVVNGEKIDFEQGKGYIEKDWGTSFPEKYVWLHTNHFRDSSTSLVASLATIPYLGLKFQGFFVNIQHNQKEYRFATYTGASLRQTIDSPFQRTITINQGRFQLLLVASVDHQRSTRLAAPKNGEMTKGIKEGLTGHVQMILKENGVLILDDIGEHAGIEFVDHLLD